LVVSAADELPSKKNRVGEIRCEHDEQDARAVLTWPEDAQKVIDLVRKLSALRELDPDSVGRVLGAVAKIVKEDADIPPKMEVYRFDAQPSSFRGEAELRWIPSSRSGFLLIDVAKEWRSKISMGHLEEAFGPILSLIPPHPNDTSPDRAATIERTRPST
jgi:hypothetical protein